MTFLVASLGLGLFAAVYRSTLDDGLEAQAAYAVPLDFRVQEDFTQAGLVAPLEAAPLAEYEALGADAVVPVIRQTGTVAGAGQSTLLGVPAETAAAVSSADLEGADVELAGPDLPEDAARLELPVSTDGGNVAITAIVLNPGGGLHPDPARRHEGRDRDRAHGRDPGGGPRRTRRRADARAARRGHRARRLRAGGRDADVRRSRRRRRADPHRLRGLGRPRRRRGGGQQGDLPALERGGEPALPAAPAHRRRAGSRRRHARPRRARGRGRRARRARSLGPDLGARRRRRRPLPDRVGRRDPRGRARALRGAQLGEPGDDGAGRALAGRAGIGRSGARGAAVRRARRELARRGAAPARKRSARTRLPRDPDRRRARRGAARVLRPRAAPRRAMHETRDASCSTSRPRGPGRGRCAVTCGCAPASSRDSDCSAASPPRRSSRSSRSISSR